MVVRNNTTKKVVGGGTVLRSGAVTSTMRQLGLELGTCFPKGTGYRCRIFFGPQDKRNEMWLDFPNNQQEIVITLLSKFLDSSQGATSAKLVAPRCG